MFAVSGNGLKLTDVVSSGGTMPVSVTSAGHLVYVVNSGSDSIAGFNLSTAGLLTPIPGSMQPLGWTGVGPGQISFDPEGQFLIVTFRIRIRTYLDVIVSEAFGAAIGAGAMSSYHLQATGALETMVGSLKDNQTAPCWVQMAGGGRFAYTTNRAVIRSPATWWSSTAR